MTRYGILLTVEIDHDYYLNRGEVLHGALPTEQQSLIMAQYRTAQFLQITPTATAQQQLAGHKLLFKPTARGFLVAAQLDPRGTGRHPLVTLDANFRLRFALQSTDPYFVNYTALGSEELPFCWFSNESGNSWGEQVFLSRPVPAFDPGQRYQADQVYGQPSGDGMYLFRALQNTGPVAPSTTPISEHWQRLPADTFRAEAVYGAGAVVLADNQLYRALGAIAPGSDLSDEAQWASLGALANQYVTQADGLALRPSVFTLDIRAAGLNQGTVRLTQPRTAEVVWEQGFEGDDGPVDTVPLGLSALPADRYQLSVLDADQVPQPDLSLELYLDNTAVRDRWLGVIELSLGSGDDALLDTEGQLRSPRYRLQFLNRASRWRYHFPAAQAVGPGADVVPAAPDTPDILVTPQPRPLTRLGPGMPLQADNPNTPLVSEQVLLPEPGVQRLRHQHDQWYSDVYLANLPVDISALPI
jgi:hypothetical protein